MYIRYGFNGIIAGVLFLLSLISCMMFTLPSAHAGERLVIQGSTTLLPIAQKAAEVFMQKHPDADISIRGGGSGAGIASLIDGVCDIADASRAMKKKEIAKAETKGVKARANIVAMDGIGVIINPSNPVDKLTLSQLKDIYTGRVLNWREVGGKNSKIVVISRDSASGTFEVFEKLVLKKARVRPDALLQGSNMDVVSTVKLAKGAIGYVGLGYLSKDVRALIVNGVIPSVETVVNGKYPISRPLFMYTNGEPKGLAGDFIDFVLGQEGQIIVKNEGFVPLE